MVYFLVFTLPATEIFTTFLFGRQKLSGKMLFVIWGASAPCPLGAADL